MTKNTWTVTEYNAETYKDLVASVGSLKCIVIANPTAGTLIARIRLADDAGTARSSLVPGKSIAAGESVTLDMVGFNLGRNDAIQVTADDTGLEFTASGEED